MAAEFIGAHMLVTLHQPPARLRGVVSDVKSGHSLTLSDVWSADTQVWLQSHLTIEAANVANLVEVPSPPAPQVPTAVPASNSFSQAPLPIADPAIISVGESPAAASFPKTVPDSGPHVLSSTSGNRELGPPSQGSREATPLASIVKSSRVSPVDNTEADEQPLVADGRVSPTGAPAANSSSQTPGKRKNRRPRPGRGSRPAGPLDGVHEATALTNRPAPAPGPGPGSGAGPVPGAKGWRQTPILENTASFQPFSSLRKARGKSGGGASERRDNGWASEDVTDVQELGEFDFEGGLAKFDKHALFDQMRKDTQIDDADLLVSHNRLPRPKPGTAGGKNLHHTENVLDPTTSPLHATMTQGETPNDFWNSEADDGVAAADGAERPSRREQGSRQSSRRGESRMSGAGRSQSRKASGTARAQGPARTGSGTNPAAVLAPATGPTTGPPGLVLLPSNRRVEPVSALQMLNLENIAHNELGLTEEMMTENAGRGLAEVTLTALTDPAVKLLRSGSGAGPGAGAESLPTVVILAGNNKSGIRAVTAGRHLRNRGTNPVVCVAGVERGDRDLLEGMRQQLRLFRNFGGRVYTKAELFEHVRKLSIPTLTVDAPRGPLIPRPPPVTLIVDALLGLATPFDELRTGEQATVYELIEWANRSEAFVLAVDVPTGIDPSTGRVSIVDGNYLYVRPRFVAAMGAPKRGLLEIIHTAKTAGGEEGATPDQAGAPDDDSVADWKLFVIDVGLGPAVWKKAGTKIRRGIEFGDKWVLEMRFDGTTTGFGR